MEGRLYAVDEVAALLGLHRRTVQVMFRQGRLRGMKVGREWKAYLSDIEAYLKAQENIAPKDVPQEIHGAGD